MPPLTTILAGVAGEYFVAAELSRRGYIASVTLRNIQEVDVLVTHPITRKTCNIQVKTNQGSVRCWIMNKKHEDIKFDNCIYVFVNLNNFSHPDYFIVPSKVVGEFIKKANDDYLAADPRRKPSLMRKFQDPQEKYLNRWDLI